MMYDRLNEVFERGYTPSILAVAEEIQFYAEIRTSPIQDRQVAAILRRHGYLPLRPDDTIGFVPGRTVEEKEAYKMIARMIVDFEIGPPVQQPKTPILAL